MTSCLRLCPTVEGSPSPLITHRIGMDVCMSRQRTFFHKCHRCIFRGKSAEWKPEVPQQLTIEVDVPIPSVNGTAKKVAKKPAPQKAAGKTSQKSGPKARPRGAAQADA